MSGRSGFQEFGAELDRESVAATLFSSQSKGKRNRDTNVVHSLKDRKISKRSLNGKLVDLAVRGEERERVAHQKFYEAEAEVEARNWEKRNPDIVFREINREFESQRLQLRQAN